MGHRLQLTAVSREDQGDYECLAENGVTPLTGGDGPPPSDVIHLTVNCKHRSITYYTQEKEGGGGRFSVKN